MTKEEAINRLLKINEPSKQDDWLELLRILSTTKTGTK